MDIPTRYPAETPLIYKAPVTIVEGFERNIIQYLRRWLGHAALPCMGTPTSVKSLKSPVSETHLTPGSPPQVSGSELGGSGGHRRQSMRQRHGILVGWVAVGRAATRLMVQGETRAEGEEERQSRTVAVRQQGAWAN